MPLPRILVGGTGTGVGKTMFTCALQRALRREHWATLALKPVETGYSDNASDASSIWLDDSPHPAPLYAFKQPLSPHLAAEFEEAAIRGSAIRNWISEQELNWTARQRSSAPSPAVNIVELAGGMFTPLSLSQTNADLLQELEPRVFALVASDKLGVLHDLGACIRALQLFHRLPDLVVFSRAQPDHSTPSNRLQFERLFPEISSCSFDRELEDEVTAHLVQLSNG